MITHLGSQFLPFKTGPSNRKQVAMNMLPAQVASFLACSLHLVQVESGQVCGKCPHLEDCQVVNSGPQSDQSLLPLNSGKLNFKTCSNLDLCTHKAMGGSQTVEQTSENFCFLFRCVCSLSLTTL